MIYGMTRERKNELVEKGTEMILKGEIMSKAFLTHDKGPDGL